VVRQPEEQMASENAPWMLIVPSDLHLLPVIRAFVEAVCQSGGFDADTTHAVLLATSEAATNVMRHAHQDRPEAQLQFHCFLSAQGIEIHLLDEGEPFDLEAVPHLDPGEIRPGGRGVFLMRALMDELSCRPRLERGNTLRMVKHYSRRLPVRDSA